MHFFVKNFLNLNVDSTGDECMLVNIESLTTNFK